MVVEMTLFCPFYDDAQWALSPMNPKNNVQKAGPSNREHVYTMDKHAGLLEWHDAVTRKIVAELKDADNLIYSRFATSPTSAASPWNGSTGLRT